MWASRQFVSTVTTHEMGIAARELQVRNKNTSLFILANEKNPTLIITLTPVTHTHVYTHIHT